MVHSGIKLLGAMSKETFIVIPCFNESLRLNDHYLSSLVVPPGVKLILVDDGSTDGTRAKLQALAHRYSAQISVLPLNQNVGKGEAVRRGMQAALKQEPAVIGYADSDGATPASECLRLLDNLQRAPETTVAVFGSRVKRLGADIRRTAWRHYSGRVFATAASKVLSLSAYDTQCGAKFFRHTAAFRHAVENPFCSRWLFDVELIGRIALGIRASGGNPDGDLLEIPLRVWHDVQGSKRRPWDYGRAIVDLFRIMKNLAQERVRLQLKA